LESGIVTGFSHLIPFSWACREVTTFQLLGHFLLRLDGFFMHFYIFGNFNDLKCRMVLILFERVSLLSDFKKILIMF